MSVELLEDTAEHTAEPAGANGLCICGCGLSADDPRHGKRTTYTTKVRGAQSKCRAPMCRAANTAYQLKLKKSDREPPWHGDEYIYNNYDCRCIPCTEANRVATLARKHERAREEYEGEYHVLFPDLDQQSGT